MHTRLERETDQREAVVGLHQVLYPILLQHHHPCQCRALGTGTVLTVYHVALLAAVLTGHKQQIEHLHLHDNSHSGSCIVGNISILNLKTQDGECGRDSGWTHIAFVAIVGWLVLHSTLVTDLLSCSHELLSQDLDVLDGLHQAVSDGRIRKDVKQRTCTHTESFAQRDILLDHLEGILVTDLDGARHIPGHVDHRNN